MRIKKIHENDGRGTQSRRIFQHWRTVAEEEEVDKAEEADKTAVEENIKDEEAEVPQQLSVTIATNRDTNQMCAWTLPKEEK